MSDAKVPRYHTLLDPLLQAFEDLGGSVTIEDLVSNVAEIAHLVDEHLETSVDPEKGGQTIYQHSLAWGRNCLKMNDRVDNPLPGVRAPNGWAPASRCNERQVVRGVRQKRLRAPQVAAQESCETESEPDWRFDLMTALTEFEPSAIERTMKRPMREWGFVQAEIPERLGLDGHSGSCALSGSSCSTSLSKTSVIGARSLPARYSVSAAPLLAAPTKACLSWPAPSLRRLYAKRPVPVPAIDFIKGAQLLAKLEELLLG